MRAGLLWFTRGYVEYQFPNNSRLSNSVLQSIEFSLELSSEVPGTSADWPSDITLAVNGIDIGTWTSPGDFGDKRGVYTPDWWKLKGSQYGKLKNWRVGLNGTYVDGVKISEVSLSDLDLASHHSIRPAHRRARRRQAPGRYEHFRPWLRQLRSRHRPQAAHAALNPAKIRLDGRERRVQIYPRIRYRPISSYHLGGNYARDSNGA